MKIYIPSYLGDVSLETNGDQSRLIYKSVTTAEKESVDKFLRGYHMKVSSNGESIIPDPIIKAHKKFIKVFKLGRPVINAIKLKDGKVQMVEDFPDQTEVGVTTEKPERGCPVPVWERSEALATVVLHEFLSLDQWADFELHKAFISHGNFSGKPYLLTSRWNRLSEVRGVLCSIETMHSICASMKDLPPAEELLALKIVVECDEQRFIGGM